MNITSEQAINEHFDQAADRIRTMAFESAKDRLLRDNEKEREQYLEVFRKNGEIKVERTGAQWVLIPVNRILQIRKRTGLSQAKFCEKYEIPKRTLENWEQGSRECPEYLVKLLDRAVGDDFA